MGKEKELNDYRHFTAPAELHKAVNTLEVLLLVSQRIMK